MGTKQTVLVVIVGCSLALGGCVATADVGSGAESNGLEGDEFAPPALGRDASSDPTADGATTSRDASVDPSHDANAPAPDAGCVPGEFAVELCGNGLDDDCDGRTDCADPMCKVAGQCGCAVSELSCSNGVDDDCNGVSDCAEPSCKVAGQCGCAVSEFNCHDGADDDCNGVSDCADPVCGNTDPSCCPADVPVIDCNEYGQGGKNCWGDGVTTDKHKYPNDGSHCAAMYNENGCDAATFANWCRRDQGEYWDNLWEEANIVGWVDEFCTPSTTQPVANTLFSCTPGNAEFPCGSDPRQAVDYGHYSCTRNDGGQCKRYQCSTPIVLQFDLTAPVAYRPDDGSGTFDLAARQDGSGVRSDWPTAITPWLAYDRDDNGTIDSGRELLGSATLLGGVGRPLAQAEQVRQGSPRQQPSAPRSATNGFEALGELDANHDGVVDASDPAFGQLLVWGDANGDRISQPAELQPLAGLEIVALEVSYTLQVRCDARGNCERERARFWCLDPMGNLREAALIDVHLLVRSPALALR